MHNKIGEHIVNFAVTVFVLGLFASIIYFIVIIGNDIEDFGKGLLVAALGCVGSWLAFLAIAGFGLLVENSTKMVELLSKNQNVSKPIGTYEKTPSVTPASEKNGYADEKKDSIKTKEQEICSSQQNCGSSDDVIQNIIDTSEITEEEKKNIRELISWKNDGIITTQECRNRISKMLSNYSIALQYRFLNKL